MPPKGGTPHSLRNAGVFVTVDVQNWRISTFTGECRHTPNTLVKDRISYYNLEHSDFHRRMSIITDMLCSIGGRKDSEFYKLANENGTLKQLYTCNQFVICKEKLLSIDEIYFQEMLQKEAAAVNSRSGGQGYTRCHCRRKCSTNKCSCKSKGFLCNSKCHNSLSCCNK
ncbi:KRAB-A domain-containing protein 2 [Trichonephila clavipes]|uniref:KRAB-A domain-containing protein 2 n=1 Tax=Trichonephila clavipes TaxID=2585209 RepID=A0A8X6S9H9_TRICX|nr:KRAB-A domain-containing protein 2 [Trichonephila clavipes]